MARMRENRRGERVKTVKEKIRDREPVFGTMISEMACPNLARIFKAAGFAYMIVDCEHGYFDYSQLAAMVSVANGAGIGAVVRIPTIDRGVITKVLDMGADGLLVPMVNTADEARQIVSYAKYPPLGHRGASTQRAHTNYDPPKLEEYFEIANARTIILAQIETRQALDHVGEIAAVEGIDAVVIGPNDLSIDLGVPGDLGAPAMKEAQRIVAEAAARAGKASGMITSRTDVIRECRDRGMTVLSCDSEVGMLLKMARKVMGELQA